MLRPLNRPARARADVSEAVGLARQSSTYAPLGANSITAPPTRIIRPFSGNLLAVASPPLVTLSCQSATVDGMAWICSDTSVRQQPYHASCAASATSSASEQSPSARRATICGRLAAMRMSPQRLPACNHTTSVESSKSGKVLPL